MPPYRGKNDDGRNKNRNQGGSNNKGQNYTGTSTPKARGLCRDLGEHVFDYGGRSAPDQMVTTLATIVEYVGTEHGPDIRNELKNRREVIIPEPSHSQAIMQRHITTEAATRAGQANLARARAARLAILQAAVANNDPDAFMPLADLQNDIAMALITDALDVPVELTAEEKQSSDANWKNHRDRVAKLVLHRGKCYSLIIGQCTKILKDKMELETDWTAVSTSNNPLRLLSLIEVTVLKQTEDLYPFATAYNALRQLLGFQQQNGMSNNAFYEKFNTKVDIAETLELTHTHGGLLNYVAKELYPNTPTYAGCSDAEQAIIAVDVQERFIAFAMLKQSGTQHSKMKEDLQNEFTTGESRYPKNRQQVLHLMDRYTKTPAPASSNQVSHGTSFVQNNTKFNSAVQNRNKNKPLPNFDVNFWKDKTCYNCGQKGHPSPACPQFGSAQNKSNNDDAKSIASQAKSINKLNKELKSVKKQFTTVNTKLKSLQEDESDISESEDEEGSVHFQCSTRTGEFQFTQVEQAFDFEPKIAKLFTTKAKASIGKLDLTEVILLDSQSTMDLFCNRSLIQKVHKSKSTICLHSNGGNMSVTKKASVAGYHLEVWFSSRAITNIIGLSNLIKQYRVTYDSRDLAFVVHRESAGKPNMIFKMHESGLHYYDPREPGHHKTFLNTVAENKEGFTKRQLKGAEQARALYSTLNYPSLKDFRWVVRTNQIQDCPVTVADVDAASKIWGKNIAALKGKTTRSKPSPVARDFVKIPKEILALHKEVFLTSDIFFVNKIPFFLTLSRKICFSAVTHLANRTVPEIFKAFKEHYVYYLQRGFRIVTVHADGEFAPLKPLIEALPGGPRVNLASANEHVPEPERKIRVIKERARSVRHSLPFERVAKVLTIAIVLHVTKMLNFFPPKGGISDSISPKTIMSGEKLDYKKHLSLQIGQYCQVHEEDLPRNSQKARTQGAICLGPSGNMQGGFKFLTLKTCKTVSRRTWDLIPMPDLVIARMNTLGADQPKDWTFTDRQGRPVGDSDEIPGVNDQHPEVDAFDAVQSPGVEPLIDDPIEITGVDLPGAEAPGPQQPVEIIDDLDIPQADPAPIVETVQEAAQAPVDVPADVPVPAPAPAPDGTRRSSRIKSKPVQYKPSFNGSRYAFAILNPDAHMFMQTDFYQADPDIVAAIIRNCLSRLV